MLGRARRLELRARVLRRAARSPPPGVARVSCSSSDSSTTSASMTGAASRSLRSRAALARAVSGLRRRKLGLLGVDRRLRAPPARAACGRARRHLGLAVRADRPRLVERARAAHAALLELAQAARAAHEVALDAIVAVRAQRVVELVQARLGGLHLQLALAHVLQVLGRAQDHVDDRAHEREQRRRRGTADEHRILDPAPRVGVRPVDQRQVQDDDEQDQQVDDQVQAAAFDSEV